MLVTVLMTCWLTFAPRDRGAEAVDVYEAVFRYQFGHNGSGLQEKSERYCLSIQDKDPPPAFLDRFRGHKPAVLPGSQFQEGKGVLFRIGSLKWIDDDTAEVLGGYNEGPLSASWNRYRVVRKAGRWAVVADELLGVS
jgi:hypothetical protein